ncbi:undecaprenyl-diphosphatase [Mesobacillus jeotgali]|uniref:Undecaprenyl-diphosphatase n=1 Tax=Mesobacillus jeotgali TaxID=129985 RepID=A0ABY9VLX8_9BACI|nr:undecaprenyl-diphosphatase [Mesobacillus jeotgali]WNF23620.1 undecaprenyl-diphosphatase [Mesobacillus jeotgali]
MNIEIFRMINDAGKEFEALNPVLVFIANNAIYLLAAAVLIYLFSRKPGNRLMIMSGLVSLILAEVAGKIGGMFHSNHQPFATLADVNQLIEMEVNNSFPSDHTIIFFTMAVTFWLFKRKHTYLWILLAGIVGLSRIWAGVHYPADILVGAILGSGFAYLGYRVIPTINLSSKNKLTGKEMKNL